MYKQYEEMTWYQKDTEREEEDDDNDDDDEDDEDGYLHSLSKIPI